jgi:hypothetical protein
MEAILAAGGHSTSANGQGLTTSFILIHLKFFCLIGAGVIKRRPCTKMRTEKLKQKTKRARRLLAPVAALTAK